jgi:hypothetical protein
MREAESEGFRRWCTFRITEFLDFVHLQEFYMLEKATSRKEDLFPSSAAGGDTLKELTSI